MIIQYKNFFIKIFFFILVVPITFNLLLSKNSNANELTCDLIVDEVKKTNPYDMYRIVPRYIENQILNLIPSGSDVVRYKIKRNDEILNFNIKPKEDKLGESKLGIGFNIKIIQ